jgi:AraC-like DNA-binding protein
MKRSTKDWKEEFKNILLQGKQESQVVQTVSVGEASHAHVCQLWDGITLWANDVNMKSISYPGYDLASWEYLLVNICHVGRCEVGMMDDRYVYMAPGMICLSSMAPKDGYLYPGELYQGLEIAFDLKKLRKAFPQELVAFGFTEEILEHYVVKSHANTMLAAGEKVMTKSKALHEALCKGDRPLGEYRFYFLELLFLMTHDGVTDAGAKSLVTKGQRRIAVETEHYLMQNLAGRTTVEELAKRYDISPSALKKYFEAVYGSPISYYVRDRRMARAKELLANSQESVGEIALSCGYENQGKFGAVFKTSTGETPLEYRRLHRKCLEDLV